MARLLGGAFSGQVPFWRKCMLKKLTVTGNSDSKNAIHMILLCCFSVSFLQNEMQGNWK